MIPSAVLDHGRAAFAEHRWGDALRALTDADQADGLAAADLERLATVSILIGHVAAGVDTLTKAHERFLADGDAAQAARCAIWIGIELMDLGEGARSAGWFGRAQTLVQDSAEPSPVAGLLLIPQALGALYSGDAGSAAEKFTEAAALGQRFRDPDLTALGQLGLGQAQIMLGNTQAGLALFDEVMVAVTVGELSPIPAGIVYCGVIGTCQLAFDLGRALEWTTALDRWCAAQPDLVVFSGQCQMHRAELYRHRGAWDDALVAAKIAQEQARRGDFAAAFGAWYQQGEVQRLRGEADAAQESYRQAGGSGFEPQPGLALLRLAQGDVRLAHSLIHRAVDGADPTNRRRLLAAAIEIDIAAGDVTAARENADELTAMAETAVMPMMQAIADQCEGAVLLAEGDFRLALNSLRRAWMLWQGLDAPYEAARCRFLAARAFGSLDDHDAASMELDAARAVFEDLGAGPALVEVDTFSAAGSAETGGSLTARELEVLRLVSTGMTNRVIAGQLYLSEKTVARHLSNIFAKLGLSSRAAATAYAYENALV